MSLQVIFLAAFGLAAVWFGIVVFRTHSMVRSALALLFSQTAIGAMFLVMQAEFLGVLQIMMMATEMSIMAIFMVMFMMDPGGLGEMDMKHQRRLSLWAGLVAFAGALGVSVFANWGIAPDTLPEAGAQVRLLGIELLGRSMLIFESAGLTILTAMIAATAVAVQPARIPEKTGQTGTDGGHDGGHEATGTGPYACPMHPEVTSNEPGNCPQCGMTLVPVGTNEHTHTHEHHDHAEHGTTRPEAALYTCPMHPEVTSDTPGNCPECGMTLIPVDADGADAHPHHHDHAGHDHAEHGATPPEAASYTCPMHPEVTSSEPGNCPQCGMTLVPVDADAADKHTGHHGHKGRDT